MTGAKLNLSPPGSGSGCSYERLELEPRGFSIAIVDGGERAHEGDVLHVITLALQVSLKSRMNTKIARAVQPANASLTIGDVAAATGYRTSAIRYYEDAGILPKPDRVSGKRRYRADTIDRLTLIRFCRRLGMSLADVRGLLATPRGSGAKAFWRRLVDGKLEEISGLIQAAQGVERILRESRDCDCMTLESCSFLRSERAKPAPSRRRLTGFREV